MLVAMRVGTVRGKVTLPPYPDSRGSESCNVVASFKEEQDAPESVRKVTLLRVPSRAMDARKAARGSSEEVDGGHPDPLRP